MKYIYTYLISLLIGIIFYLIIYYSGFNNFQGGAIKGFMWDSLVLKEIFYPIILLIAVLLLVYNFVVLLPVTILLKSKLKLDIWQSLIAFLFIGFMIAGLFLFSIEPVIATDYFVYGVRQEYNKYLEIVGYNYVNTMVYLSLLLISASAWFMNIYKNKISA
jgi:hypothetical protein